MSLRITPFVIDRVTFKAVVNNGKTLEQFFNEIKLSHRIPYATFNNLSKVYTNINLPITSDWISTSPDIIELKFIDILTTSNSIYQYLRVYRDTDTPGINIEFEYKKDNENKEYDISNIESLLVNTFNLPRDFVFSKFKPHGVFYVNNQKINIILLLDMIMNNPGFDLLTVNEHDQTLKSITTIIYDNKSITPLKRVTFVLTEQEIDGQIDIRINISTVSSTFTVSDVEKFKDYIVKIIGLYNSNVNSLRKTYSSLSKVFDSFLDDLEIETWSESIKDTVIENPKKIADATKGQASRCSTTPNSFETKEEALNDSDNDENKIFQFPKNDPSALWYSCSGKKKTVAGARSIWPGLTKEPYIPCCYQSDQMKKKNSSYKNYYSNDIIVDQKKRVKQQLSKKPGKRIFRDEYGVLPENIISLIYKFTNDKIAFERVGVDSSDESFLEIMNFALSSQINNYVPITKDTVKKYWFLLKQSWYNQSKPEIVRKIDTNVDTKALSIIFERLYNCNIFILNDEGIIYKTHRKGFYREGVNRDKRPIILYENTITQTQEKIYELIINRSSNAKLLDYPPRLTEYLLNIYIDNEKAYSLSSRITTYSDLVYPSSWKPIKQRIDNYGRTRTILFEGRNNATVLIDTEPIAPIMKCEVVNDFLEIGNSSGSIQSFTNDLIETVGNDNINITRTVNGNSVQLSITSPTRLFMYTVIIKRSTDESYNTIDGYISSVDSSEYSKLQIYKQNKLLAHYICEYSKWMYATTYDAHNGNIKTFANNTFVIDSTFKYAIPSIDFDTDDSNGIMKNGKIVLQDKDVLKHVLFTLLLTFRRNPSELERYRVGGKLKNYHLTLETFDKSPDTMLYKGSEFITIYNKVYNHVAIDFIKDSIYKPYFFYNKNFDDGIYIAYLQDSLTSAQSKCVDWADNILKDKSRNIGYFNYVNPNTIYPMFNSSPSKLNIISKQIMGIENVTRVNSFTVLLKL